MWETVTSEYWKQSCESNKRDPAEIKKYFITKLCNNNKKPTGKSTPDKFVSEAQKIYSRILENESADNYGG